MTAYSGRGVVTAGTFTINTPWPFLAVLLASMVAVAVAVYMERDQ